MTLILVLASELEVHMTCDFKLTNAHDEGALDVDAHKLVQVSRFAFQGFIGVTGIATLEGLPIAQWLEREVSALNEDAALADLIPMLREAGERALEVVPITSRRFRHLAFVIAAVEGSQGVVATLANFDCLQRTAPNVGDPGAELTLTVTRPSKPFLATFGSGGSAVRKEERTSLIRSASAHLPGAEIRRRLAAVNRKVAARCPSVSAGCVAASQFAKGLRGESEPYAVEQTRPFVPPTGGWLPDLQELISSLMPSGAQVRAMTSVTFDPSPAFFREQIKMDPENAEHWANYGAFEAENGRPDDARVALERAIELKPLHWNATRNLGGLLAESPGDRERGRELLKTALASADNDPHARSEIHSLLAGSLLRDGDTTGARHHVELALDAPISPRSVERLVRLAIAVAPEHLGVLAIELDGARREDPASASLLYADYRLARARRHTTTALLSEINDMARRLPRDVRLQECLLLESLTRRQPIEAGRALGIMRRHRGEPPLGLACAEALVAICAKRPVASFLPSLATASEPEARLTHIEVGWAFSMPGSWGSRLNELHPTLVHVGDRVEAAILSGMTAGISSTKIGKSIRDEFSIAELRMLDSLSLRLIREHPLTNASRANAINSILDALDAP